MIKKCPVCNSTRFRKNVFGEKSQKCLRCGYSHTDEKTNTEFYISGGET